MARNKIDMTGYKSKPRYMEYNPDCPQCGEEMGYSNSRDEFKCPLCGYVISAYEYSEYYENDDGDIPSGCAACGGPYPSCKTSCKMFDEKW